MKKLEESELFCGIMFHTVNNCYLRNSIVTDRIKSQQDPALVPFQRYGEWIISEDKIPSGVRDSVSQQNTALSTLHNKELTMFNNVFASTDRGKQLEEMSPIEILMQMEKNRDEQSKNSGNCSPGRKERQLHVHDDTVEATATRSDGAVHVVLDMQGIHVSQRDGCEPVCQKSTVRGTVSSELERLRRPELVTAQDSGQPMELEINAATELPNSEKDTDMLPYTVEEESMFLQQTIHRATLEKKGQEMDQLLGASHELGHAATLEPNTRGLNQFLSPLSAEPLPAGRRPSSHKNNITSLVPQHPSNQGQASQDFGRQSSPRCRSPLSLYPHSEGANKRPAPPGSSPLKKCQPPLKKRGILMPPDEPVQGTGHGVVGGSAVLSVRRHMGIRIW